MRWGIFAGVTARCGLAFVRGAGCGNSAPAPLRTRASAWAGLVLLLVLLVAGCSQGADEVSIDRIALGQSAQALGSGPTITSLNPSRGAEGAAVTLTGTGFSGATAVSFGAASATFNVVSDTSITTTVPTNAASAKITVTTSAGSANSAVFKITPTLASFAPTSGGAGTAIVISGTGLTQTTTVTLTGITAAFTVVNDTTIDLTVPAGASNGKIVVTTVGGAVTSTQSYAAAGPTITSFTVRGIEGASVTVNGTGFVNVQSVAFGAASPSITVTSATQLKAVVPPGAITGPIVVTTPLGAGTSTTSFDVLPTIASFNPTNGAPGETITLTGTGLAQASSVSFGGTSTSAITVNGDAQIQAIVPGGAATGKLMATTTGGSVTSTGTFTVQSVPVITALSPASAAQGATVTITGTGFLGVTGVAFGGIAAPISSSNATTVKVVVPTGAITSTLTVTNGAGTGASASLYPVLPKITSLSPASGGVGSAVSIAGSALTGAVVVDFGSIASTFNVVADGSITTTVPAGAVSAKVTVTTQGGTATSAASYKVIASPIITSFTPTTGAPGSTVTIKGTALTGATNVSFNGTPATSFNVASATSVTAVVPSGATTGPISILAPGGAASGGVFTIAGGKCAGVVCTASDACHLAGTCNGATGVCSNPTAPNGTHCDDGNACTQTDTCNTGACGGSNPVVCTALDACHDVGTCAPPTGACTQPTKSAGALCSDGNVCNGIETCNGSGTCAAGSPPAIDDGNPCTSDSCDPAMGVQHTPTAGASCSDGNACNGAETCSASAACVAGTAPPVDDGNPCTTDACDPAKGVTHTPIANCGAPVTQPLPAPPLYVDTAPATLTVAGVDFIDPNGVLSSIGLTVTTASSAPSDQLGADAVYQMGPVGALPKIVYARIPTAGTLSTSAGILSWTRSSGQGAFRAESLGRVVNGGKYVSIALDVLGQLTLTTLSAGNDGATNGDLTGYALGIAPLDGALSFHNVSGMSVASGAYSFYVASFQRLQRGLPASSSAVPPQGEPLFSFLGGVGTAYSGIAGVLAETSQDFAWLDDSYGLHLDSTPIADTASSPSISADGKTLVYVDGNGQIQQWNGPILSVNPSGQPGNDNSASPVVARSGHYAAFLSIASDLDATSALPGIYFVDLASPSPHRLAYTDPSARDADCAECVAGQIPFAVSDGGRYVFLEDDYPTTPLPPRGSSLPNAVTYARQACRNAYRYDRVTSTLTPVAYGDWFSVDRGGRTIASHPCRENDNLAGASGIDLRGFLLRDMTLGKEVEIDPRSDQVSAYILNSYGYSDDFSYEYSLVASGAMTGDGNSLYYVLDGFTSETYTWQVWGKALPTLIAPPPVSVNAGLEYTPINVTYSGMPGETMGDLLTLVDDAGHIVAAHVTNGQNSGTFSFNGVHAGTYAIDAYAALSADPPILKRASRTQFIVGAHTAVMTVENGGPCEYVPFDVDFSNFLALSDDDQVVLSSTDTLGGTTTIDTQRAEGKASGTLHFADLLQAGDYVLQVFYGTPGDPGNIHPDLAMPVTVNACLTKVVPSVKGPGETCRFGDVATDYGTLYYVNDLGISSDGSQVTYLDGTNLHVLDRRHDNDVIIASNVHGFGASKDGTYIAFAIGTDIYMLDNGRQATTTIPANVDPQESISIRLSADGHTLAHTNDTPNHAQTYINVWNLAASPPVQILNNPATNFLGCFPDMTDDGTSLVYSTYSLDTNDCLNSFGNEARGVYVNLTSPQPQADCVPAGVLPLGDLGYGEQADATVIRIRSDGKALAFASVEDPYLEAVLGNNWVTNPPAKDTGTAGSSYLITQLLDGSQRVFRSAMSNPVFFFQDLGETFYSTNDAGGGGLWWQSTDGKPPVSIFQGSGVAAIRPSFGPEVRVAFTGKAPGDSSVALWVAPY